MFVNLPRSRRGQRRPRGWHGVLGPRGRAAAGATAGGRAWQVGARPRARSVVRSDGSAGAARRPWGAAREGGGEGRRGAWRREGARREGRGARTALRPRVLQPDRVPGPGEGACSEGTRARARTSRAAPRSRALLWVRAAGAPAGWLAGRLAGGREGMRSAALRLSAFPLRSEFPYLQEDSENAHMWGGPGAHCLSGFCPLPERPAIAPERFSTPIAAASIECALRGPAHSPQKPRRASAPFFHFLLANPSSCLLQFLQRRLQLLLLLLAAPPCPGDQFLLLTQKENSS